MNLLDFVGCEYDVLQFKMHYIFISFVYNMK